MKQTELKRKTPLRGRKMPIDWDEMARRKAQKANRKKPLRRKAKPKGRRGRLEAETEKRCMAAYRNQPCIICLFEGVTNTYRTCGHHIVPKSRCRPGRHDPANIVPLCQKHHTMGNDCAPHSSNPLASAHFDRWLERWMPRRFKTTRKLDERARQGPPYRIGEVERDYDFWATVERESRPYKWICEGWGVEAYAEPGRAGRR